MICQVQGPSSFLPLYGLQLRFFVLRFFLRDSWALVLMNGDGPASAVPMPRKYQVARRVSNFNSSLRGAMREQTFGHSSGNASVAMVS